MRTTTARSMTPKGTFETEYKVFNFEEDLEHLSDEEIIQIVNLHEGFSIVELKKCPFCGTVGILNNDTGNSWYGWCKFCDSKGPHSWDWIRACRMWNKRFKGVEEDD